jgi:hypothetical protein
LLELQEEGTQTGAVLKNYSSPEFQREEETSTDNVKNKFNKGVAKSSNKVVMAVTKAIESHKQDRSYDGKFSSTHTGTFSDETFLLDSGASHHVCNNLDMFQSIRALEEPRHITLGDNSVAYCTHMGEVLLILQRQQYAEGDETLLLTDVMYVRKCSNIVSVSILENNEISTTLKQSIASSSMKTTKVRSALGY